VFVTRRQKTRQRGLLASLLPNYSLTVLTETETKTSLQQAGAVVRWRVTFM